MFTKNKSNQGTSGRYCKIMAQALVFIALAVLTQGCQTTGPARPVNGALLIQGLQGVQNYGYQQHYGYIEQEQAVHQRARESALPMRNYNTQETSRQDSLYERNPSEYFMHQQLFGN